jgi:hypothetical protein
MTKALLLLMALSLSACVSATPEGGAASYDSLKQAQDKCALKGGSLALQKGGDPHVLDDYSCKAN